jgi:hypothetical protein
MNIKELIETLSILDPELRVVTRGYEGGYDDIEWPVDKDSPNVIDLALNVNPAWYYGNHEMVSKDHKYGENIQVVKAIVL